MKLSYLIPVFLLLCGAACRRQTRGRPASPARVQRSAAVPAPAVKLSREDMVKIERLYYRAVDAYTANDMKGASSYVTEILDLNPAYKPALELRENIKKVSGY